MRHIKCQSGQAEECTVSKIEAKRNSREASGTLCSISLGCEFTQKRKKMYKRAREILVGYSMQAML